jgi:thymidylate synthase (FAD)
MKVTVIDYTSTGACYDAAWVCRDSDDPEKALEAALKAGHDSLMEHWSMSFLIEGISRACSHQLIRHRIGFSYAQQSQRHVKVADGHEWYVTPPGAKPEFHLAIEVARQSYLALIDAGMPLEDARYVLPNACYTTLVVTANARALDHFFKLRCCKRAQWEIRKLANEMLVRCKAKAPVLFKGPYPDCASCKEKC